MQRHYCTDTGVGGHTGPSAILLLTSGTGQDKGEYIIALNLTYFGKLILNIELTTQYLTLDYSKKPSLVQRGL